MQKAARFPGAPPLLATAVALHIAEAQSQDSLPVSQLHELQARMFADLEREGWD